MLRALRRLSIILHFSMWSIIIRWRRQGFRIILQGCNKNIIQWQRTSLKYIEMNIFYHFSLLFSFLFWFFLFFLLFNVLFLLLFWLTFFFLLFKLAKWLHKSLCKLCILFFNYWTFIFNVFKSTISDNYYILFLVKIEFWLL